MFFEIFVSTLTKNNLGWSTCLLGPPTPRNRTIFGMHQTPLPRYLGVVPDRGGRGEMIQPIAVWCDCNLNLPPAVNGRLLGNPIPAHVAQNLLCSVTTRKHHGNRHNERIPRLPVSCSQRFWFLNYRRYCCVVVPQQHNNNGDNSKTKNHQNKRTEVSGSSRYGGSRGVPT